ncbi:MAG: hypothetical protein MJZ25_08860 [Fibrobacter sp.]|nr:hypothetical protein [Fibrobacter sp.]
MFTGYFDRIHDYEAAGCTVLAICGKVPDEYRGPQYKKLAPKLGFFNEWKYGAHKGDNAFYVERFGSEVLDNLVFEDVVNDLKQISGDLSKLVLLCYEAPGKFCHRHLVSAWFTERGLPCTEFSDQDMSENLIEW